MPEGLQLLVTANTTQAEKALGDFVKKTESAGKTAAKNFDAPATALKKIPAAAKPAIDSVNKLKDSIFNLQEKINSKKNQLFTEKDTRQIQVLTKEIRTLEIEMIRVKNIGKEGFDQFGTAVVKSTGALSGLGKGANTAFGAVRKLALFLPGIGVAGLIGLGVDFFANLITGADDAKNKIKELLSVVGEVTAEAGASTAGEAAKVRALAGVVQDQTKSYTQRNNALKELKEINKGYFGDISLESGALTKLTERVNEYVNALIIEAKIKGVTDEISRLSTEIVKQNKVLRDAQKEAIKAKGAIAGLENAGKGDIFGFLLKSIGKANVAPITGAVKEFGALDEKVDEAKLGIVDLVSNTNDYNAELKALINTQTQLKPLKLGEGGGTGETDAQRMEKLIARAKKLADFLDSTTIRSFRFEVDPRDTLKQTYDKAVEFIDKAVKTPRSFKFKQTFFEVGDNAFDKIKEAFLKFDIQGADLRKNLQSEVDNAFAKNPLVIQAKLFLDTNKARAAEAATKSGVNIEGLNAPVSLLTKTQKQAINTANTVRDILTPAFQDLFTAIKDGENPLKAFFQGIGDAIGQLIQKLIAAAIQAAILSALFPGGLGGAKGFKGFFKSITGFAAGGIVSGPTLAMVGEGRGTSRSNPEVIAPLDQLKGILSGLGGGGSQRIEIVGRTRGQDIRYSQVRTSKRNLRNTGA